jgi:hypothetical protein
MKKEDFDKFKEKLIEEFDWEKVHKIMTFLNWEWHINREDFQVNGVPTVPQLKEGVLSFVDSAIKAFYELPDFIYHDVGGFKIFVREFEKEISIEVMFVPEDYDSDFWEE